MSEVVSVAFNNGPKLYDYFTDLPLKVGDLVVVPAGAFYSVVTVKKVKVTSRKAEKFVVQRVDLEAYNNRLAELVFT